MSVLDVAFTEMGGGLRSRRNSGSGFGDAKYRRRHTAYSVSSIFSVCAASFSRIDGFGSVSSVSFRRRNDGATYGRTSSPNFST
jgi:hypothetical protein